jgi:hypothetical protein
MVWLKNLAIGLYASCGELSPASRDPQRFFLAKLRAAAQRLISEDLGRHEVDPK